MYWYKINERWAVDLSEVRAIGKPTKHPDGADPDNLICLKYKNNKDQYFIVKDRDKVFDDMCFYLRYHQSFKSSPEVI